MHKNLLSQQGFICCYCGMRITRDTSHIEHFKPRSIYPQLALEYNNLLASCQRKHQEPLHCGYKKNDWYDEDLMVSPLGCHCADFFRYSGSGEIMPTDDPSKKPAAETTISQLGLDIDKLRAMRSEAIEGVLLAIEDLIDEEIQKFAHSLEQIDQEGQYQPFSAAIAYFLNQYYSNSD